MISKLFLTLLIFGSTFSQNQDPSPECLSIFRNAALKKHNELRALHGSPPLTLNLTISIFSQNYANYLAKNLMFAYNVSSYGMNLARALAPIGHLDCKYWADFMTKQWYDEKNIYEIKNPHNIASFRFTQLVWKDTSQIGIGLSIANISLNKNKYNFVYYVANYFKPDKTDVKIAEEFNVERSTVTKVFQRKDKYINLANEEATSKKSRIQLGYFSLVEEARYKWYLAAKSANIP
ncbi:unnamed protein product [Brachionus calyciflorus]|uniref:SCP domain-containing protein n=1 Tax=Brachionus calyciflorus TaxID=104777 RepID=A0A813NUZ5_9BILA|nr:unnamed protein product [Brachionus calyciflorus]